MGVCTTLSLEGWGRVAGVAFENQGAGGSLYDDGPGGWSTRADGDGVSSSILDRLVDGDR